MQRKIGIREVAMSGVLGILAGATMSYAQTTVNPDGTTMGSDSGRTIERDTVQRDGVVVKERVVERRHEGEPYVAVFGGFTLGMGFGNVDGTGALRGSALAGSESLELANSAVYGMKIGYFLPTRKLNWLGFELEGFSTSPHIQQQGANPGSHLRVSTVAINVIARKRMACHDRDRHDRTRRVTTHDKDGATVQKDGQHYGKDGGHYDYDKDGRHYDDDWSPEAENERCPLQLYAGAGPAIFFANTSNQYASSSENGEVGVNALAGVKYFVHRNVSIFGEYKFNYAGFDFTQYGTPATGASGGITGNYKASHFVGGLAVHF